MARIPQQNQVRPPAGPGALANRQDLTGNQPQRIPTGLPYGEAGQLRTQEQAVPMPQGQGLPGAPASPQGPPQGSPGAGAPEDPRAILAAVSGHGTDFPQSPLSSPPPDQSAMNVVDALRHLSLQPFATPQVFSLLQRAQDELQNAARDKLDQALIAPQPLMPSPPSGGP